MFFREVNVFIGCMLGGVCNPDDSEQMDQFQLATAAARAHMPADCGKGESYRGGQLP